MEWTQELVVAKRLGPQGAPVNATLEIAHSSRVVRLGWKDEADGTGEYSPQEQRFEMAIQHLYRKAAQGN